jgi:superfamily II DNA or RNA helicase
MDSEKINVTEIDTVFIRLETEKGIAKELSQYFTFDVPNHKYMPAYRNKFWDGKIRLFGLHNHLIYRGLLEYVKKFAHDRNYQISGFEEKTSTIDREILCQFIENHIDPRLSEKSVKLHRYQIDAIKHALEKKRCLLLSPTGSGKSMIIYGLLRYYLKVIPPEKKILIIVPTTGLVQQMISDFSEYSGGTPWKASLHCHGIHSGRSKETAKRVVVTTWQSVFREPKEWFDSFSVVFGDECHQYKSNSLVKIMTKLKHCPYRIGTTGTLDGLQVHRLIIEGLFGKTYKVTSTKDLIDNQILSQLNIECLMIKHSDKDKNKLKRRTYQEEIEWIVTDPDRNKFITDLAQKLKGNTLILFNYVEKQGKPLMELLKNSDKEVHFIYGKTETELREEIRRVVDSSSNSILVASYGTTSTGINIRNIHNIIFASPSKSCIRVLQSIGRGLRKSETKQDVTVYDISDDLIYKKYKNHTFRHLEERMRIYKKERFHFKITSVSLERNRDGGRIPPIENE